VTRFRPRAAKKWKTTDTEVGSAQLGSGKWADVEAMQPFHTPEGALAAEETFRTRLENRGRGGGSSNRAASPTGAGFASPTGTGSASPNLKHARFSPRLEEQAKKQKLGPAPKKGKLQAAVGKAGGVSSMLAAVCVAVMTLGNGPDLAKNTAAMDFHEYYWDTESSTAGNHRRALQTSVGMDVVEDIVARGFMKPALTGRPLDAWTNMQTKKKAKGISDQDVRASARGEARGVRKQQLRHERLVGEQKDALFDQVNFCQDSISIFSKALFSGDISSLVAPMVEGETEPAMEDLTKKQVDRVRTNAYALRDYYKRLVVDIHDQLSTLSDSAVYDTSFHNATRSEQAAEAFFPPDKDGGYSWRGRYIREVLHPQWRDGAGEFKRDGRGSHVPDYILNDEDLKNKFLHYLLKTNKKHLTVDIATDWVNSEEFLGNEKEKKVLAAYGVSFPVGRSIVHGWMLKVGGTVETVGQSYYTDRHNDPDVTEFKKKYTATMEQLEERCALWVQLTEQQYLELKAAQPSLEPRRRTASGDYEFHVDDSECFLEARLATRLGGAFADAFDPNATKPKVDDWTCDFRHSYDVCRCHQPAVNSGQDESIFKVTSS
jgi:hypothetical protein